MKLILSLVLSSFLLAQSTFSGVVLDEDEKAIEFANVYVKGGLSGSVTDVDGKFSFQVDQAKFYTLVVSFTGYKTIEKKVLSDAKSQKSFRFILKEDINRDDVVTVTASAFITDPDKKAVVARPLDVVTTPGAAADINRFFQTMPGVTSTDEGAGLFVRGGNVQETVMEIDGATLIHPYKFESPSGGFFGTIRPFLTKGSAFYTGALSAEFGNVLSGLVDMQSIGLLDENAYQFGLGLAAISARIDHIIKKDEHSISMSGNYSDTERMMRLNNNRYAFNRYPVNYDINITANSKISDRHYAKLFLFREKNEVGAEIVQPDLKRFYSGLATNHLANLALHGSFTDRLLYKANLAYSDYSNKNSIGNGAAEQSDKLIQAKWKGEYLFGDLSSAYFGVDYRQVQYKSNGNWHFHPDSILKGIAGDAYKESHEVNYLAAHTEVKLPVNKDLLFRVGLRYESESEQNDSHLDPRLSITYKASDYLTLSTSYGRYHQVPKLSYYLNRQKISMLESSGFTLGLNYDVDGAILLRTEFYYKEYKNLIKKIGSDSERRFDNSGFGRSKGIDILLKQKLNRFEYWLSYSYLEAERDELYFVQLTSPEFDITHNFTIVTKRNLSESILLGSKYVYRSGKPYQFSSNPLEYNTKRLPSYKRFDINISYLTQWFNSDQTIIYAALSNLFGEENILNRRYNADYSRYFDQKGSFKRLLYFGINFKF